MALENLFSVEPTLPNLQNHKMPDNPERWAELLSTYLREQYPDVAKLPLTVEFRKRDDQAGAAIGALHVTSEEAKKSVFVPFIIKEFHLSPLDIWMEDKTQKVHPLTKDTFKEVFFVQSPAEGMDARPTDSTGTYFNDPSLWTTNMPPLQGRYSYASAGYPMLDSLSDTFKQEDVDRFKNVLREAPHTVVKFQKHGHKELIEKIAKKSYPNTSDYASQAMKLIPTAAVSVKKEGDPDKYSLLSQAEGLFDTAQVQKMTRHEMERFLSKVTGSPQDTLLEVDQEGEKMLIMRKPAPGVFLYDEYEAGPESAKDFAAYRVKTRTGLTLNGVVVPHVVDYAGKKMNYKLFISPNHASFQSEIAGVRLLDLEDAEVMERMLKPADIRVGQTGTFMYLDNGKALCTKPVTIKAVEQHGPLTVCDLNGKTFSIRRGYGEYFTKEEREAGAGEIASHEAPTMPGLVKKPKRVYLDAHGMIEIRKDIFVIPEKMCWIPMEGFNDVSATPAEWIQKEAAQHMQLDPLTVRYTGIVFDVSGAGLPKMALDERATKLLLATSGVPMAKIAVLLKTAKTHGKAKVHGTDRLKSKEDKHGEVAKCIAKLSSMVKSLQTDFTKEAADMNQDKDKPTIDALLSLNFLNADNLAKFVSYKPVFDKVLDYLAELTLASRLGARDIPEASVVGAMSKLMDVCDGLGRLQVVMKRPSTKTAAALPMKAGKKYLPSKVRVGKLIAAVGG